MHKVVSIILKVASDEDALDVGRQAFDELIARGEGGHDYHTIFNSEDDNTQVSGTDRWGAKTNPLKLKDKNTLKHLNEVLENIKADFFKSADEARKIMTDKTNGELLDDAWSTWHLHKLYLEDLANTDNYIYVFREGEYLESIYTKKDLDELLDDSKNDREKFTHVVLADVHW